MQIGYLMRSCGDSARRSALPVARGVSLMVTLRHLGQPSQARKVPERPSLIRAITIIPPRALIPLSHSRHQAIISVTRSFTPLRLLAPLQLTGDRSPTRSNNSPSLPVKSGIHNGHPQRACPRIQVLHSQRSSKAESS